MILVRGFFGKAHDAEQTKAAFVQSNGRLARIADFLNIGNRAKLKNALLRLETSSKDPHTLQAFYDAFNARAKDVTTDASRLQILRALLGTSASSLMPELAKLSMREVANSKELLAMSPSEIPLHLQEKIKELAPMFGGLFATRTATHQLIPVAAAEFNMNGFSDKLEAEEVAVLTAGSPDNIAAQVAMRHSARRDGLHATRRILADKAGEYSSTGSRFASSVKKNNERADQCSSAAVTRLEQSGISSVASLIKHIEGLIAAVETNNKLSSGTVSNELSTVRNDLNGLLKSLQKDSFTIEDVRGFMKVSDRAISTLEKILDNKTGVFSAIDSTQFFREMGSERSQIEKGIVFLKREVKLAREQVQSFDYFKSSAKALEAARKTAHEDVNGLRGQVAKEERFFKLSEKKQSQQLQSQYESELKKRMTVFHDVKSYMHVPSTSETLIGATKTAVKVGVGAAVLVACGAAAYNHSSAFRETIIHGLGYMPESVVKGMKLAARPVLNLETTAFDTGASYVRDAVTYATPYFNTAKTAVMGMYDHMFPQPAVSVDKGASYVQDAVTYATPYFNTAKTAVMGMYNHMFPQPAGSVKA